MLNIKSTNSSFILLKNLGIMLKITSVFFLFPLIILPFYQEDIKDAYVFIVTSLISLTLGVILSLIPEKDQQANMTIGQDSIFVVFVWGVVSVLSAIPFMLGMNMSFTHAVFESVSGWTTTGLSVVDVTQTSHIFLFYRSLIQFFGGVGLILIFVSALSATFGLRLYNSEGHSDRLFPNLLSSSRMILSIYSGYFVSGTVLYVLFGMPVFDAVNHSMAALSTGGFSTKAMSIGAYNSFSIELITIILMILGSTNFAIHLLLISGKFKKFFKLGEIKFMFLLLGVTVPLIGYNLFITTYSNGFVAFRHSLFQIVSALTTTGFQTVPLDSWPSFSITILVFLMIIGGGVNSTAGGIKYTRVHLMLKAMIWSIIKKLKPAHYIHEKSIIKPEGKYYPTDLEISESYHYSLLYLVILAIGTLIMTYYGYTLEQALFEFSSALSTVGISTGLTGATTPDVILWVQTIGMFLGRLEIIVVFIAMLKIFSRFKRKIQ